MKRTKQEENKGKCEEVLIKSQRERRSYVVEILGNSEPVAVSNEKDLGAFVFQVIQEGSMCKTGRYMHLFYHAGVLHPCPYRLHQLGLTVDAREIVPVAKSECIAEIIETLRTE